MRSVKRHIPNSFPFHFPLSLHCRRPLLQVIFHRTPEPSTFPGAPSMPSVSDITENSMRLAWKANPNHGASPVFAYTVEYFSHETGEGWIVAADSISEQVTSDDTAYSWWWWWW